MYNTKFITGFLAVMVLLITACEKQINPEKKGVFVSTSAITNITTVSAQAAGDVDFAGKEDITERGIVWAATPNPSMESNKVVSTGTGSGNFTADISGLTMATDYYVKAYVVSNGQIYYGNEVKFTASAPVQLIKNGDFTLPDDGIKHNPITAIPEWKTDDTVKNRTGRGYDYWKKSGVGIVNDFAKPIYQVVGTVPAVRSDYDIEFDAIINWTTWGNYKPKYAVIFSAYTGNDPTTRVPIGSVEFTETQPYGKWPGKSWGPSTTGTFSIPAGSQYAGQKLVIEFDVLPFPDPSIGNPQLWYHIDNFSVIQTLK